MLLLLAGPRHARDSAMESPLTAIDLLRQSKPPSLDRQRFRTIGTPGVGSTSGQDLQAEKLLCLVGGYGREELEIASAVQIGEHRIPL